MGLRTAPEYSNFLKGKHRDVIGLVLIVFLTSTDITAETATSHCNESFVYWEG